VVSSWLRVVNVFPDYIGAMVTFVPAITMTLQHLPTVHHIQIPLGEEYRPNNLSAQEQQGFEYEDDENGVRYHFCNV